MSDTHHNLSSSGFDERVREALNAAKMALWELDLTEGKVTWTGRVASYFLDFAKSIDGSIESYRDKIHPEDVDGVLALMSKAKEGQPFVNQHRILFPDNSYHWVESIGELIATKTGFKMTGTLRDITEKKQMELDREDWKIKHEMVATATGVVVYDYDINSGKIDWSGSTQELFGYESEELGDIDAWVDNVHPEDRKKAVEELDKAEKAIGSFDVIYRFKSASNEYKYVHDKGFFYGDQSALKMLGMMDDITDQRRNEAALIESEARFKSMIHDLNIGVGLYDLKTVPILCNRKSYELLGLTQEQLMGRVALSKDWKVMTAEGEMFEPEEFPIPRAIKTGKSVRETMMGVFRPALDDWVWLMVDAEPIYDSNGEFRHVVCTYSDITELRRAQSILSETNRQLERLSKELQGRNQRLLEFAQIVSHNLRSPISSIVALAELHGESDLSTRERIVEQIDQVGKNALETIEELNDVLKVQQGNVERDTVDFESVLNAVILSYKGLILEGNVSIRMDFKEESIHYPKIYLESLFMNLLSNSIKYRKPGVPCRIKTRTRRRKNGWIRLDWEDNGLGIDLSMHQNDIFQLGKTFHGNNDSRGVGLFLIRNQIESMGGTINLVTELGNGTTFKINFKDD